MHILVGWHAVDVYMRTIAAPGNDAPLQHSKDERFRWIFTEEVWRRALGAHFKAKPVRLFRVTGKMHLQPSSDPTNLALYPPLRAV